MIYLKMLFILIWNILVFLSVVIPRLVPIWKWPAYWRHMEDKHEMYVRQLLTELTMTGQVKRRVVDGEFRYYPMDYPDEEIPN